MLFLFYLHPLWQPIFMAACRLLLRCKIWSIPSLQQETSSVSCGELHIHPLVNIGVAPCPQAPPKTTDPI